MKRKIAIFDSTLRDGAQAEGISFSLKDKIKIVAKLDNIGVAYIEAGNPGSNKKDADFFAHLKQNPGDRPKHAKLVAFGSTRRKGVKPEDDKNIQNLLDAGTETVCVFGKASRFQVTEILKTDCAENLEMIRDTVNFLRARGLGVIFDAEHFFDGYKEDPAYAMECLSAAGAADCLVLCDTKGGAFPDEIYDTVKKVVSVFKTPVGIHCHNDCGMAVANSVMAAKAGAAHIQGTFTGFGERCGNTNLSAVIPNLQLKRSYRCIPENNMVNLRETALTISEIANVSLDDRSPYVGASAFAHKGGMHIDGVQKRPESFEHIEPSLVGNDRRLLISEVAGRSTVLSAIQRVSPDITRDAPETENVIAQLKALENEGYQFEAAESSFDLRIRKLLGKYSPKFQLENFKTIGESAGAGEHSAQAMIKVIVDGKAEITAAEGNGPVNALDRALRKALEIFYPQLGDVHLTDYKVRVLDGQGATAAKVRVLIESTDGVRQWTTVGVSHDIIEASWIALVDSIEYKLIRDGEMA
ncbi:MAG: citramalate synthase [Clostridiales bacterium]|nr:citramalate synthase [Clostridiales bacterium]